MKIAIIGATGFLGSHIMKYVPKKYKIVATYKDKKKINKKNLNAKQIEWKLLDIYKKKNFYKYLNSPDIVVHLAWSNLPNYHLDFHLKKELPMQKRFVLNLVSNGLKNIFIAGTCFEYGNQGGKLNENIKEIPNNKYSKAKCKLKNYVFLLKKKYQFNLTWGRIFYIYGKHNSRPTLYNQVLKSSKKNNSKITVFGNILRDYLHINVISKIIIFLILARKDFGLINICSGKGISLKTLIKRISKLENIVPNVKYIKNISQSKEPNKFWGCNMKLKYSLKSNN